jgi:3-methylcrotonyl-CoA carboxylase alpha subunit
MITKILIANRGEIACRVIKTAVAMGLRTVAVYSDIDAHAKHTQMADEAYCIGEAPAAKSYLCADKIIKVALESGAEAIHPGYGFLSEDAGFARLCEQNNIIFIGPSADAIESMGSKSHAKTLMRAHKVPITPGYEGDNQDNDFLCQQIEAIGYPVLVKASAGGGGKGMRLVTKKSEALDAIQSAKREAKSSFSDDTLLLERYVTGARHVEVQIFTDNHGNGVYLHDRDCSVQRRHQKIVEEAPAPGLSAATRQAMGDAALAAAKAINYSGAGTIEFLLDTDHSFYFMEMNTRLQVEHPVTEMITGIDLVEWQILIAANEVLEISQDEIPCNGHAIEARVCAEDPARDYAPSSGHLSFLTLPTEEENTVRVDSGVRQGDDISPYYDPMIAKVIAWGEDRDKAISNLSDALAESAIIGVDTNIAFLMKVINSTPFTQELLSTDFLEIHNDILNPPKNIALAVVLAALADTCWQKQQSQLRARHSHDVYSPWYDADGWRAADQHYLLNFWLGDTAFVVDILPIPDKHAYLVTVNNGKPVHAMIKWLGNHALSAEVNGVLEEAISIHRSHALHCFVDGERFDFTLLPPGSGELNAKGANSELSAPMHGTVLEVLVKAGDTVKQGEKLFILEAMKMEHSFVAPYDGTVDSVHFSAGNAVHEGDELLTLIQKE